VWLSLPQPLRSNVYVVKTQVNKKMGPTAVLALSKAWVCDGCLAGIAGSNPAEGHRHLSPVGDVCCQVGVSATELSLVHRSPTGCVVSNLV